MGSYFVPVQNRYFDPYQQKINSGTSGTGGLSPINTKYSKKYLSRISNQQFLKSIGNNFVLKGLDLTLDKNGAKALVSLSTGFLIHDDTLISFPELPFSSNFDFDVTSYGDTPTTGSHLCIFSNFQYIETPDTDAQTALALTIYHVDNSGTPSGSPTFSLTRNKVLIGIIDFTKTGANISSISESALTSISILGTTFKVDAPDNLILDTLFNEMLGASGTSGTSGANKSAGTSGTSAISGTSGTSGSSGSSGTSGSSGFSGTRGTSGSSGSSGINRTSGTSSLSGLSRTSGTSGTSESSGTSGTRGAGGSSGTSGTKGSSGTSGTSSGDKLSGTSGTSGISRTSGSSGNINITSGTSGISGSSGSSGTSKSSGSSGTKGSAGISTTTPGVSGTSGTSGKSGSSKLSGTSGTSSLLSGSSGSSGTRGTSGTSGSSGTDISKNEILEFLFLNNL